MMSAFLSLTGSALAADGGQARSQMGQPVQFKVTSPSELRFTLANGLAVYLIRDSRFPLVCTRLFVRTGSTHESPDQFGISHVLEHMVFKGTTNRPKGQIAREVEALGGYLNAYTSFDKTCYLTDIPSRHWKTGVDIVKDMAFHPLLDAEELEKEKPVIISELEGNEDAPASRLFLEMQAATLTGTPYGHPIIGTRETVRAVTPASLQAYIDRWYQPQNMLLVVAGDIDLQTVRTYVEASFSGFANRDEFMKDEAIDPATIAPAPRIGVTRGAWNKVYLGLSFAVPGLADYSSLQLDMLSALLAGDGTSWFERRYRLDRRLVDSISVDNIDLARVGMFSVVAVLDADRVEEFFTSLVRDLAGLKMSVFTDEQLARVKFNVENLYDRQAETLNGLASLRARMEFELGGRQGEANMRAALASMDFDQIGEAYARYLRPERLRLRVMAPEQAKMPDFAAILDREWPISREKDTTVQAAEGQREVLQLDNGVQLVLLPDDTMPYLSLSMLSPGGNALLDEKSAGLATLTASLLGDGCGDMDRLAFETKLTEKAMAIKVAASRQAFAISATGPSRFSGDLFSLVRTMMDRPAFDEKEFDREIKELKNALVLRDEDPIGRLMADVSPMLFGTHAYGLDRLGTAESLAGFTTKDVAAFWQKQKGMPWVVSVAGVFDREAVLAWAGSLPRATETPVKVTPPVWGKDRSLVVHMPDKNKAHLVQIFPTVAQTDPDVPGLMLMRAVLSGQSGLLFSQLRDNESIGYTVAAENTFLPEAGLMLFYAGTTQAQLEDAKKGFARIIQSLKDKPLDKPLLEAGCNAMEGKYIRAFQSLSSRADQAAKEILLGLPRDYARLQIDKAREVTPEDLQNLAKKYFHDGYEAVLIP